MAYGQSSFGKTHSMLGNIIDGSIPKRAVMQLFNSLDASDQNLTHVSYIGIYLEQLRDLLCKDGSKKKLEISQGGQVIRNLSKHVLKSPEDIFHEMEEGEKQREF